MAEEITLRGMTRDDARATRRTQSGGAVPDPSAKPFIYRYRSPGREFKIELKFRRSEVERQQIAAALREAAEKLEGEA
jgi:ParB family chromosome partitioning protein